MATQKGAAESRTRVLTRATSLISYFATARPDRRQFLAFGRRGTIRIRREGELPSHGCFAQGLTA